MKKTICFVSALTMPFVFSVLALVGDFPAIFLSKDRIYITFAIAVIIAMAVAVIIIRKKTKSPKMKKILNYVLTFMIFSAVFAPAWVVEFLNIFSLL